MTVPHDPAFAVAEYRRRLEAVQSGLVGRGLDALLAVTPATITYLSGFENDNLADLTCLVVPADRDPVLVLFWFEEGRALNSAWVRDVRLYRSPTEPRPGPGGVAAIAAAVGSLGLSGARLALESGMGALSPAVHREVLDALPSARMGDATGVVEAVRLVKSPAEIAYMREAAAMTDAAVEAGTRAMAVGARDTDLAAVILETLTRLGSETVCFGPIVASGFRAGAPHSSYARRSLERGDTVFLELTAQYRRYTAPLMRTGILGEPTPEQARAAAAGAEAVETVIRTARPGATAASVARAATAVMEPVLAGGLMFHYNFGYPVGIGYPPTWTEPLGFYLRADNERPLEAGMTFHLPVSIRRFGEWGICQSHTMLVTETGAVPLTRAEARLQVIATA